ncbi:MAG: histidine phosphatase family protein, partial [Coriobacteriia bacterium]|nr:histidine phosphatase family protein [Coriobacteriia bacterium]
MRLYLLRHGPALSREEWAGPDELRPLSDSGMDVVRSVAHRVRELDLGIDVIVTSPYERALRTAMLVHGALELPASALIEDSRLEPGLFDADALGEILRDLSGVKAVMVVGHEPSMGETLAGVIGGGRFVFKKGGLALVDL